MHKYPFLLINLCNDPAVIAHISYLFLFFFPASESSFDDINDDISRPISKYSSSACTLYPSLLFYCMPLYATLVYCSNCSLRVSIKMAKYFQNIDFSIYRFKDIDIWKILMYRCFDISE